MLRKIILYLSILGVLVMISVFGFCNTTPPIFNDLSVQEATKMISENGTKSNFVILDVRREDEFRQGHIAKALLVDFYDRAFSTKIDALNKNKVYLVYCRTGNRSGQTSKLMQSKGFKEVYNMLGGIVRWHDANLPIVSAE